MDNKYIITPSILSADFTCLGEQIAEIEKHGAGWIHIDVIDGHFAPNLTMGFVVVKAIRRVTRLPLDVHLMVDEPERWIKRFVDAGADSLTVHIEACPDIKKVLNDIKELGCKAAVTLKPETAAETIKPVLDQVNHVLVMTVNPGYSGQSFIPETVPKVKKIRGWLDEVNPQAMIQVDGGISVETLPQVIKAGARVFVAATAVFKHPQGPAAGMEDLKAAIDMYQE